MQWDIPLMIMTLVTVSVYLLLHNRIASIILGVAVFSNAINLIILTSGGTRGDVVAPIVSSASEASQTYTDPLPHALILTAIVIGFGLLAFFIGLMYKLFVHYKTENIESIFKAGKNE